MAECHEPSSPSMSVNIQAIGAVVEPIRRPTRAACSAPRSRDGRPTPRASFVFAIAWESLYQGSRKMPSEQVAQRARREHCAPQAGTGREDVGPRPAWLALNPVLELHHQPGLARIQDRPTP